MPPTRRRRTGRASKAATSPQKAIDHTLNAPTVAPENDPFHPQPPKSYDGMSNPPGNTANYLIAGVCQSCQTVMPARANLLENTACKSDMAMAAAPS